MNKGQHWVGTVANIKRAKLEIADEENEEMRTGSWVAKIQKKHKSLVLRRAQRLAENFVDLLQEDGGKFMSVFAAA
eukprot:9301761-Prorocentrum_lima.AAC.1